MFLGPPLFAREIVGYSDVELDRIVQVEDPENLPEEFLERLRMRARTAQPQPHAIYVAERQPLSRQPLSRPPLRRGPSSSSSTMSYDPEVEHPKELAVETEHYNALISDGGRPSHPISLGRDILKDPGEYREIISYWQKGCHDERSWQVFGSQRGYWESFRKHQQRMRKSSRFPVYCQRVQDRLRRHGFERPFQLHKDLEQQEKLTTWIEFLQVQYEACDSYENIVVRDQSKYDEAWKTLEETKVLRPWETAEYIGSHIPEALYEEVRVVKAVDDATLAVKAAERAFQEAQDSGSSEQSLSQLEENLAATRSKLAVSKTSFESCKRRAGFTDQWFAATREYRMAKPSGERAKILARWILQQVPLIELELNSAEATEDGSNTKNGGRTAGLNEEVEESPACFQN
ncbi:hypothetical protein B7494_g3121 [Chlorociboria aeruginascens]|nr:hypothetical protein B7494_g3121 [Chlorociboria aeruginascens]